MFETAAIALTTFFATISPIDGAVVFAALTVGGSTRHRRQMAIRGTIIATTILLTFALAGELLLASLGISLAALRTAGGILLLLIAIDMVFARISGGTSTTAAEAKEAELKADISVFPLATPLIAGPGAMGAAILLMANTEGDIVLQGVVIIALLTIMLFTLACLLLATQIQQFLGITGMYVITRILGILLAALAIQFIFDGIQQSGLLG